MKKQRIAASVAALFALGSASAFAQNVTLSGRASMEVSSWEALGAAAGSASDFRSRTRVADTGSRIAFGVTEDLGGGLRAGVYCETGINIDSATANGQANTANANTSEWCSREGRASIGSGNIEFRLGRQNVWWTEGALNTVGSTLGGTSNVTNLFNGGTGVLGVRLENMMKLAVTGGEFAGSELYYGFQGAGTGEAAAANTDPNGRYSGAKLTYSVGQFVGMVDYQESKNSLAVTARAAVAASGYAGANGLSSFNRSATKVGLGFRFTPTSMLSVQYWDKKRTDQTNSANAWSSTTAVNTTQAGNGKDSGYAVNIQHNFGNGWQGFAQMAKANDIKGTTTGTIADSGATGATLGGTYSLSKRTHLYGAYHMIRNEQAANYGMPGGNYQSGTPNAGSDTRAMALGMIHNF